MPPSSCSDRTKELVLNDRGGQEAVWREQREEKGGRNWGGRCRCRRRRALKQRAFQKKKKKKKDRRSLPHRVAELGGQAVRQLGDARRDLVKVDGLLAPVPLLNVHGEKEGGRESEGRS